MASNTTIKIILDIIEDIITAIPTITAILPTPIMVVGEVHQIIANTNHSSNATTFSLITRANIDSVIRETVPISQRLLFISEGKTVNSNYPLIVKNLKKDGYSNFTNMNEITEKVMEKYPDFEIISNIHSVVIWLSTLDYYKNNPSERFDRQINLPIDIRYFDIMTRFYQINKIFDESILKKEVSFVCNMVVYNITIFNGIKYEDCIQKIIKNFCDKFKNSIKTLEIKEILTDFELKKNIETRLLCYERYRTKLRAIRDNILIERINRNSTNFDFIVMIIGSSHYNNICELISLNPSLSLSTNSFNVTDPNIFTRIEEIFMKSLNSKLLLEV